MIIRKPISSTRSAQDHHLTTLHFEHGASANFYMRGSIAWPENGKDGFALLSGQSVADGVIYLFEQAPFLTIEPWLTPTGAIHAREDGGFHTGLIRTIHDWFGLYQARFYFYGGQHPDIVRRHQIEIYRSDFSAKWYESIDVPYVSELGESLIKEKLQTRKFVGEVDSPLAKAVDQWSRLENGCLTDNCMIHALKVLLCGYEYQPFRKRILHD